MKKSIQKPWQNEAKKVAQGIRRRFLEHTLKNNGGYLSQACSSAEIFACLYKKIMNLGPVESPIIPDKFQGVPSPNNLSYVTGAFFNGPKSEKYDRFFLSPSQYSLVLYAALIEVNRMHSNALDEFNKDGSIVEMIGAEHSPGMEVMSGSLGQGLSQAIGIALARKLKKESGKIWVFMSDGEFQIGQTWEALLSMSYYKLDNVKIIIDANGYQCDGKVEDVMNIEPLDKRLHSFGAKVDIINGHDINSIYKAANQKHNNQPLVVIARTCPYKGIEVLKKRAPKFHYIRFTSEDEKIIKLF